MEKSYFGEFQDFGYPKLANPLVNANRLRTSKTVFEKVKWVKLIIEKLPIPQFPHGKCGKSVGHIPNFE